MGHREAEMPPGRFIETPLTWINLLSVEVCIDGRHDVPGMVDFGPMFGFMFISKQSYIYSVLRKFLILLR